MNNKKLTKSRDKKICGVCGGIAEYLNMDPTVIRLITLVLILFGGLSVVFYFIAAIVMPDEPSTPIDRDNDPNIIDRTDY